jgi:endonuclease/exonuclease/phosphatase family metal-dependent hydrolase
MAPDDVAVEAGTPTSASLRVVTWNILVPVFCAPSLYPFIDHALLDATTRRTAIHRRLSEMACDVVLLQECARSELDEATAALGPLGAESHGHMYRGVVEAAQSFEGGPKQDWGVAIAWRTGALRGCAEVDCVEVDGAFGPLPVAVLRAFVVCWGEEALFVCAHLDGEGCPPSVLRSRQQLAQIAEQVMREASRSGVRCVVWGGDFNQPTTSPAIGAAAVEQGLRIVSGQPDRPTCYVSVVFGRIDHVLSSGCDSVATEIPRCPNPTHRIKAVPGYYYGQVMLDCLCITSPPTATPGVLPRVGAGILALLLIWLWLPVVLVVVLCPLCMRCTHRDRCAWALGEWGSDHLPVLVELRPCEIKEEQTVPLVATQQRAAADP